MAGGGKTGAWSAKTNDKSQWIQVDFGEVKRVTQIASQGRSDYAQWVTKYKVFYSIFGKAFISGGHVSYAILLQYSACFSLRVLTNSNDSGGYIFLLALPTVN